MKRGEGHVVLLRDSLSPSLQTPRAATLAPTAGRFAIFTWLWAFGVGLGLLMFPNWTLSPLGWLQAASVLQSFRKVPGCWQWKGSRS